MEGGGPLEPSSSGEMFKCDVYVFWVRDLAPKPLIREIRVSQREFQLKRCRLYFSKRRECRPVLSLHVLFPGIDFITNFV